MIRAGVAGQPIAHSLSPLIHGAWIRAAGLEAEFAAYGPADEAGFERLVDDIRGGRLRGLNVTAPFKAKALALAAQRSSVASECGSANLLVMRNEELTADSTDGEGLLAALQEQAPELVLDGAPVVVLGAGGAGRAAAAALAGAGASVSVINRTRTTAERLAVELGVRAAGPEALSDARLVVNALSATPDIDIGALGSGAVLMDMTYRPLKTAFLAAGEARGLTIVDGLAMLIGQARPSFRALFGQTAPDIDVRALALAALNEAGT